MISYKKIDEKEQILESLEEIALLIMLVDLNQDTFRVIHTGNGGYFRNLQNGSFQWFIQCYMNTLRKILIENWICFIIVFLEG